MAKKKDHELLVTAIERFERLESRDSHNIEAAKKDLRFTYNIDEGQWPDAIREDRARDDRPCLTSNKLRKFVSQVANRERDQRFAGNVRPVDDKGDKVIADIYSGLIRQIEHASRADRIYTYAGEHAVAGGFGYWRITAEELDDSFEQELFIREIKNQFSVQLDPDGLYGFIREKVTKDEFKRRYPKATEEDFSGSVTPTESTWYDGEYVYISEYFYKERVKTLIVEAVNNLTQSVEVKEISGDITEESLTANGQWTILRRKTPKAYKVKWAKITQSQVLEEGEWAGKDIPIIEVEGDWVNYDGTVYKRSLITDGKDDQRMFNYWLTYMTEFVALSVKAPYLVTMGMIKGLGKFWDVAHKKMQPYLPFKPQGNLTPRREPPPQVPTGGAAMLQLTQNNIQDSIGMYDSSFGEKSNERTGIAIQQRAQRSDFGTFHFQDNFRQAVLTSTRMLIDLIPKIYDTPRVVRILGEETIGGGQQDGLAQINSTVLDGATGETVIVNDLSVGKYDVVEDVKIMSTRRQESLQGMMALSNGNPQLSMVLAPRIAEMQDWPNAKKVEEDIKEILPAMLGINQPPEAGQQPPEA